MFSFHYISDSAAATSAGDWQLPTSSTDTGLSSSDDDEKVVYENAGDERRTTAEANVEPWPLVFPVSPLHGGSCDAEDAGQTEVGNDPQAHFLSALTFSTQPCSTIHFSVEWRNPAEKYSVEFRLDSIIVLYSVDVTKAGSEYRNT